MTALLADLQKLNSLSNVDQDVRQLGQNLKQSLWKAGGDCLAHLATQQPLLTP